MAQNGIMQNYVNNLFSFGTTEQHSTAQHTTGVIQNVVTLSDENLKLSQIPKYM
jgi:hypothetical protein